MNEAKGAKGGYNDRRRTYIITKNKIKKDSSKITKKSLQATYLITGLALSFPVLKALLEICSQEKITSLNLNAPDTKKISFQKKTLQMLLRYQ